MSYTVHQIDTGSWAVYKGSVQVTVVDQEWLAQALAATANREQGLS